MTTLARDASAPAERCDGMPADRWFGVGRSDDIDARAAGEAAAAAALGGRTAALLVVFCPSAIDLVTMLDGVRARAGDVPVIGCTGIAQYADQGTVGPAVVVNALGGDGFEIETAFVTNVSGGQRAAGEQVAGAVELLTREHKLLLLLCDGLAGEQHDLVRGAYSVVGAAVPMAGGCASDDFTYTLTSQFIVDASGVHVLSDAVVAAAIGSDAPIGVGVAHGWRKVGEPMLVTSSDGGHVRTLDGRPALDLFLERLGATNAILDEPQALQQLALNHPLGMSRRSGEDIRVIHGGDRSDGSITCLADVPQGALLWSMESDLEGLVATVDQAYDEAIAPLGCKPPLGLLAFDCGVRALFLGPPGTRAAVDRLSARTAGVAFGGFFTYGEIARTRGARGMHHLTLVLVAFG